MLLPDRLPSLVLLVGFWIPPAVAGWVAAGSLERGATRDRTTLTYLVLAAVVITYAAAWFLFNLNRMPPYIPGATMAPPSSPPRAVAGLAVFTSAFVLPGSAVACILAFRRRRRTLSHPPSPRASA